MMKGLSGMQQIMKQAQQMQTRLKKMKEELADREFEGQSGGGSVKVKINGAYQCVSIQIEKDVLQDAAQSDDSEMLQDLILTALNQTLQEVKETSERETNKVSGGLLSNPGLF